MLSILILTNIDHANQNLTFTGTIAADYNHDPGVVHNGPTPYKLVKNTLTSKVKKTPVTGGVAVRV